MVERLYLCGLSKVQRAQYPKCRELRLHGTDPNVRLRLDDVRRRLFLVEPEMLADLAEIAVYVFAADCAVSRGGVTFKDMGKAWRRDFRLVIAVRQPASWRELGRLDALRQLLQFLSDDTWRFEFVELEEPPGIQDYLGMAASEADKAGDTSVMLFSGGLDSFAGAVHELRTSNRHVVLVSRRLGGLTDRRQSDLAGELKKQHPRRITHIQVTAGLTKETHAVEGTQRTRSFLFAAIGLVAAVIETADRVRFYENGIMSVNLPISTQVVGTHASRSTHPRSLLLLNNLIRTVWDDEIVVDNPFVFKTKVEVVEDLSAYPEGRLASQTLSCSNTRNLEKYKPHCGRCAQCLQRRISTLGAGAREDDPDEGYAVDLFVGHRRDDEDRAMAVDMIRSALDFRRLSEAGFATKFAREFGCLLTSFPGRPPGEIAQTLIAMFQRHGNSVREIFVKAVTDQAAAIVDETLPESCLLRMWSESPEPEFADSKTSSSRPSVFLEANKHKVHIPGAPEAFEILLAIDETKKQIWIDGIAPIKGATDYRVISVLAQLHQEDRLAQHLPENFRFVTAEQLAAAASSATDTAGRKMVSRLRERINLEFAKLFGSGLDASAVIENVYGKGYRLNPAVRVVAYDELAES